MGASRMRDIVPGVAVSWFQRRSGNFAGSWRKAVVKRLTARRVVILLDNPKPGEDAIRTVTYESVEFGWKRVEMHAEDGKGLRFWADPPFGAV